MSISTAGRLLLYLGTAKVNTIDKPTKQLLKILHTNQGPTAGAGSWMLATLPGRGGPLLYQANRIQPGPRLLFHPHGLGGA